MPRMTTGADRWSRWLTSRRDGGDSGAREASLRSLALIRDRVLDAAGELMGATCSIAGAARASSGATLERVGATGSVILARSLCGLSVRIHANRLSYTL